MRELLLAYLFDQLEPTEKRKVEEALATDPELRTELQRLKRCLEAESSARADYSEPPPDLVERTCELVAANGGILCRAEGHLQRAAGLSPVSLSDGGAGRPWSPSELVVAVGLTIVAAMLFFPAMLESRVQARRAQCQLHLMQLGEALRHFANANGGAIPHVRADGPGAFAGVYVVELAEGGYVDPCLLQQLLVCPADMQDWEEEQIPSAGGIPTWKQLVTAPEWLQEQWKQKLSASYAYRFGYFRNGKYLRWHLDYSHRSALMADAPSLHLEGFQSANHGGRGQNVLLADGSVAYISMRPSLSCGDHLFKNTKGYRAAGLDILDAVLGRSEDAPKVQLLHSLPQH